MEHAFCRVVTRLRGKLVEFTSQVKARIPWGSLIPRLKNGLAINFHCQKVSSSKGQDSRARGVLACAHG